MSVQKVCGLTSTGLTKISLTVALAILECAVVMEDTSIHHENPEIANVVNTSLVPGHSSIRCL